MTPPAQTLKPLVADPHQNRPMDTPKTTAFLRFMPVSFCNASRWNKAAIVQWSSEKLKLRPV